MIGYKVRGLYDERDKERQKLRKGKQPGVSVVTLPQLDEGKSRDKAGAAVGVSGDRRGVDKVTSA